MVVVRDGRPDWAGKRRPGPPEQRPWRALAVGQVLCIPPQDQTMTYQSFTAMVSAKAKLLGYRLRSARLPDGTFECYREG